MMERSTLLQVFIRNFVQKEKAERCYGQLTDVKKRHKFTDRLNHELISASEKLLRSASET